MRIAEVAVRADDARGHIADRHAVAHLRERRFIMRAEHFEGAILMLRLLRTQRCYILGRERGFARKMLLPRGIAIGAPRRHRALAGPLDPALRIDAGFNLQFARAFLIGICPAHYLLLTLDTENGAGVTHPKAALTLLNRPGNGDPCRSTSNALRHTARAPQRP
jgi:hypothetical protein